MLAQFTLEDLLDLGEALRRAGHKVSPQQLLAVQQLLLRLAAEEALPADRRSLARWLAPVLCTSAAEQRAFDARFTGWLGERFADERAPDLTPEPRQPGPRSLAWRLRWLVAGMALLGIGLAAWFMWQDQRARYVTGMVRSAGEPVAGATVLFGNQNGETDDEGRFVFRVTARELPLQVRVRHADALGERVASQTVGAGLAQRRQWLYLGAALGDMVDALNIILPARPTAPADSDKPAAAAPTLREESGTLTPLATLDLSDVMPQATLADRIVARDAVLALAPLGLFAAWLLLWLMRRPVLQRLASRTPPRLREVHVPGAVRALLPSLPLRRLAQELRRRRAVDSSEIQVEPTVFATLRRGGQFTAVRGSRVEPEYIALVDRAGLSDHQALLAAEVVAELARSDVLVDRYDFDRDARVVRARHALGRSANVSAVELAELYERQGEHRVLVFSDGGGCFDGFTGEPSAWALTLAQWPLAVLVTPVPVERWGRREWVLQRMGIQVLPLSTHGLVALMGVVAGLVAPPSATDSPAQRPLRSFERTPRRWVERDAPAEEMVEQLIAGLRDDLGDRGLAWVAACAAYPEVHWGITLRLGAALVPEATEFERLLPRLARLVWFREAYLPDWLRERLLEEIEGDDEARARATLRAMLEAVARGGADDVPLRIATGTPGTALPWWRKAWAWLRARSDANRAKDLLRTAPADSPLRDHVFLRFLSGASMRRLDFRAPGALLGVLRGGPTGRPFVLGLGAVVVSAALASVWAPVNTDTTLHAIRDLRMGGDGKSLSLLVKSTLGVEYFEGATTLARGVTAYRFSASAAGWHREPLAAPSHWQAIAPGADTVVTERQGTLWVHRTSGDVLLAGSAAFPGGQQFGFNRDGSRFALVANSSIRVWDTVSGALLRTHDRAGSDSLLRLRDLNRDGTRLVMDSDRKVSVLNIDTGAITDLPAAPDEAFRGIRFSPDGARIVGIGTEFHVWDAVTGSELARSSKYWHETDDSLTYSPDGRTFAVPSGERGVQLWRDDLGSPPLSLAEAAGQHTSLAFSPDGTQIAVVTDGKLGRWQVATGQRIGALVAAGDSTEAAAPPELSYSADGHVLAVSADTGVTLWRVPPTNAAPTARRSFALLVGNDYPRTSSPLSNPVRDVRAVGQVLRSRFGFDTVTLENAGRDAVLAAVDKMLATALPDDRVLLMLSGHGSQQPAGRFVYPATPATRDFDIAADAVSAADLMKRLNAAAAGQVLVVIDAAYAQFMAQEPAPSSLQNASRVRLLMTSFALGNMAFEGPQGSPFAVALAAALRESTGALTDKTLLDATSRRMALASAATTQRPGLYRLGGGAADTGGRFDFPVPLSPPDSTATPAVSAAASTAAGGTAATAASAASQPNIGAQRYPVTVLGIDRLKDAGGADLQAYERHVLAVGDGWFSGSNPALAEMRLGMPAVLIGASVAGPLAHAPLTDPRVLDALASSRRFDAILLSVGLAELVEAVTSPKGSVLRQRIDGGGVSRAGAFDENAADQFTATLQARLRSFVAARDKGVNKGVPIFVHTYDNPVPRPAMSAKGAVKGQAGPWLYPAFTALGIPPADHAAVARELMARLAAALQGVAGLTVIDTRGTLISPQPGDVAPPRDWANELQPTPAGYRKLAAAWQAALERSVLRAPLAAPPQGTAKAARAK